VGGSSIPGIGLPMCLISSEILIKRLRGDTSTEALPEPLMRTVAPAVEPDESLVEPVETS
jgi:hypothetical protein